MDMALGEISEEAEVQWAASFYNISSSSSSNSSNGSNNDSLAPSLPSLITIMDYPAVTPLYIFLCCLVWLLCVVGNSLVLVVMIRSPSLRTRTNLFMCHLAAADLSVGLVCVVPNIVVAAKVFHWFPDPAGRVLCKLYNFFEEFSLTASVLLLVLIAAERYVAIIYPLKARQLFTRCRMYTSLFLVWLAAVLYNVPLLMIYETATIADGRTYCYRYDTDRQPIRMDIYHVFTFLLTYVLPLLLMGSMYLRVSLTLWKSSPGSMLQVSERQGGTVTDTGKGPQTAVLDTKRTDPETKNKDTESRNSSITSHTSQTSRTSLTSCSSGSSSGSKTHKPGPGLPDYGRSVPDSSRPLLPYRPDPGINTPAATTHVPSPADTTYSQYPTTRKIGATCAVPQSFLPVSTPPNGAGGGGPVPASLNTSRMRDGVYAVRFAAAANSATTCRYQVTAHRVLQSRRKVIRLLVAVLLVFALCVLPFHLKLLLRYGLHVYLLQHPVGLLDFVSQLLFFLNSALNPVLYSLMSHSFRRSARQVLGCDSRSPRH